MIDQPSAEIPRIFISYSWTSEEHIEWVADLGERLMNDGIDVVLDQWSLEDGQDVNAFMEKMVIDSTIKRVIIVLDDRYVKKANQRQGGVGAESQIISQEVYEKVDQNKFIPLVRERDQDDKPLLPVFLQSRKYIDFSNFETENESYEKLIRNIYERPKRQKPTLGRAPAHIFDNEANTVTSVQKGRRFRDFVASGKGNPSAAFDDFAEEFISNFEELRQTHKSETHESWCEMLLSNIEIAKAHRNVFIDVIQTGVRHVQGDWFLSSLLQFLERLLTFQNRPNQFGKYSRFSEDNYKFLIYELFLYTLATCIKSKRYDYGTELLEHQYFTQSEALDSQHRESFSFTHFQAHPESLENQCAATGNTRRLSVRADQMYERSNRFDILFSDLLQADILCCIRSTMLNQYSYWHPQCLVYASEIGKLELFARATSIEGFEPLKVLLKISDAKALIQKISSEEMSRIWNDYQKPFAEIRIPKLFNLDNLQRAWP
ncbi:toll/interleukin-1 receptor domain-containing protein [Acaryochloris marina NIES-2412]|uniref:toll/interleukin-1 receptor domain-containing protein n=1 Tax=Acaryochloris marina TaxID=155978 RepID=UPI0040592A17